MRFGISDVLWRVLIIAVLLASCQTRPTEPSSTPPPVGVEVR